MNDEELKKLWQQQPLREPRPSAAQLALAAQSKMTGLRRILDARDLRELIACAVVVAIFGVFYFTVYREPVSRLGDLIVIGGAIFIAFKIIYTRRTTPPAPPGATTVESLRAELNSVRAQSHLLKTVFWWYLLPLLIGILIATWGLRIDVVSKIVTSLFFVVVDAGIWWVNQWARAKQLLPAEAQLESLLRSAETGEPLAEAHVADLRPIVLSMAAAEHVKPVEFKVAFWQLALYGEIGFVGIWFFLILGLGLSDTGGKAVEQAPKTPAPVIHAEGTDRYSNVARNLVDLINAGDYDVAQKMFNRSMSKALPPKEAFEFFVGVSTGFGRIEKVEGPTKDGYRGWTAYHLYCQRGELTLSLALDAEDRIAGLYILPTRSPLANIGSFIALFFTGPHLLWLALFFLGGLLYTWLIQKTTVRAVGISSLGIHLQKGQTLVLWDDIKEVRPMKFLNVRNLWLISASGEKTLMHWTPLERHADLKAAVEAFAPANHPIRQRLPLLKRIKSI